MLQVILLQSAFIAFCILFIDKIGLRGYIVERSKIKILSKLFACDFCLSFWCSLIVSILLALVCQNYLFILIPLFSTPITRILL